MSTINVGAVTPKASSSCFEWNIKKFCIVCKDVGSCLESPEFSMMFSEVTTWKLQLFPKGYDQESEDHIALFLHYFGNSNIAANVTLSLLNNTDLKVKTYKLNHTFDGKSGRGFVKFASKEFVMDPKNQVLVEDTLKILCEINCSTQYYGINRLFNQYFKNIRTNFVKNNMENDVLTLRLQQFDDFEKILENEHFSDISIAVGETKFQAHKAIIAGRSTVFEAMLKNDMKEKQENTIEISDIKSDVMKEVLRFMYTGKVNNIEEICIDLLMAAEKYCIIGLKTLCIKNMYGTLKIENALEYLKLADLCNIADLKSRVIEFIASNQKAIAEKPEFGLFTDLHSGVQLELVRAIIAKNSTHKLDV